MGGSKNNLMEKEKKEKNKHSEHNTSITKIR